MLGIQLLRKVRIFSLELVELDLTKGILVRLYELRTSWRALCSAISADLIMLEDPQVIQNLLFIPFRAELQAANRGGILIDWVKDSVSIISLITCVSALNIH